MNYPTTGSRHILEEIVWQKKREVAQMCQELTLTALLSKLTTAPPVRDFLKALQESPNQPSLIAEVKKASPSRGIIRADFDPIAIAQSYQQGGASCLSVLTDEKFFQGSFENLHKIRQSVDLPLLCKEFIIDPYQIYFARSKGADAVLLIAAILSNQELQSFLQLIHDLGMNALVEVHTESELERVLQLDNLRLVGINNRNLEDFTVDIAITQQLLTQHQQQLQTLNITVVSESGLYTSADLSFVAQSGARAVLVGESLIKQPNIKQAVQNLLVGEC
ncbi:MAG: indole-3-glycerol phosphate synthase TrpC [Cyanomargarita calcarea GSE-NOS-MK-12-04C]|jgi:indole-3-glycerol phosphate synthase|uniref:Indole-3-glycerol phosphate synthase n=1 Tax=Cyanomargarita calcarea GSE-NOS-MK-12-04C TaxID=2839659 RepID=A0A951UTP4_9CYAN|nr:indole-3-glycerol phosphate synthase TrpC [Cyanomargarita calcarea GSE-NOS-MK-12-04C]